MVDDYGQLYTIEGIAAAVIMLVTAYIMLNTTTLYTPADTHVIDMQLQQLGNDALSMMDTTDRVIPSSQGANQSYVSYLSPLEESVRYSDTRNFNNTLKIYANSLYGNPNPVIDSRPLQWNSTIYYRTTGDSVGSYPFANSERNLTGREHYVTVTRWVHLNETPSNNTPGLSDPNVIIPIGPNGMRNEDQVVLLEVLLWRD